MTCAESEIMLHALLDGELDAGHAREVETHLEGCPRCAAQLRAHRDLRKGMSATQLRLAAPRSLRRRIESALPAAPARTSSRRSVLTGFAMGSVFSAAIAATAFWNSAAMFCCGMAGISATAALLISMTRWLSSSARVSESK